MFNAYPITWKTSPAGRCINKAKEEAHESILHRLECEENTQEDQQLFDLVEEYSCKSFHMLS